MARGRGTGRQRPLPAPAPLPGGTAARPEHFRQASLDDLGAPLVDTTFVVVDLETTGGSPTTDTITEVGAVKLRGGEVLGTFQTLVDPGRAIPPTITVLTGITQAMVAKAPRIETVLPSLLEFMGDAVVVGHNVRFDVGFLQAALERDGRPPLTGPTVDTVALARRLVRDEVPDCRLGTLADRLRLSHKPSHRALDDALATADLLHVLLERAGSMGVTGLDDLVGLPAMAGHPQADKLRLTERLPRRPGVYLFRARDGRVLYVGKATNLRSRVRSYFSTDERRKIGSLLRETARIDHKVCPSTLEASVLEARLIRALEPRYNSHGTRWRRYPYLKLTLGEAFPRLSVVRAVRDDGALYVGPLRSTQQARAVAEAIETVVPLRRCTQPVRMRDGEPVPTRSAPCAAAQLGVSLCPCGGSASAREYAAHVQQVVDGLTIRPDVLLVPLRERMDRLATEERFEEAATARDRLAALVSALERQRRIGQLLECERLLVEVDSGEVAELRRGVLWQMWPADRAEQLAPVARPVEMQPDEPPARGVPVDRDLADELTCVASWLDQHATRLRLHHSAGTLASAFPRLPDVRPRSRAIARR
ncbi:DEDD exonuclease domain-containing protein [Dermatobacter hominis]|uniref:DEDD exonuclease domain-containing protein n=1 Tax=Dermatobacter hominis TaxID=2884263 RepID=UPI001D10A6D3|nr:DEDD exonuclease domain-containing protein [Dermatobacter hominis]UDY35934.1 DEDD exonuclease domain-containing protein [Dermatobacter hominis]